MNRQWYLHVSNDAKGDLFFMPPAGPNPVMKDETHYEDTVHVIEYEAFKNLSDAYNELVSEMIQLKKLRYYTRHDRSCEVTVSGSMDCTCGFVDLLTKLKMR